MYDSDKLSNCRSRPISTRRLFTERPALPAIMGHSRSFLRILRGLIIASHDNAILPGPEQHREYALAGLSMKNRRLRHRPVLSPIRRMKHPCGRAAGPEPDIVLSMGCNAGPAR